MVSIVFKKLHEGQVQWLMSLIPVLQEAEVGGSLKPRSLRPAWEHSDTLSLYKKLAQHSAPVVPATREAEAGGLLELQV